MTATRRDFLTLLGGLLTLPVLPSRAVAAGRDSVTAPSLGGDVLIASRADRRLSLLRDGRVVRSVPMRAGPGPGLADGIYTLTDKGTRDGMVDRGGVSLQRSGSPIVLLTGAGALPSPLLVPAGFLAQGPALTVAAGTPLVVVERAQLRREVLAVSRLPAWPGAVGVAGWLEGSRSRDRDGAATLQNAARGGASLLLVVGRERSIHLIRDGKVEARVATALRNPRQPLATSAHMLTSSLRRGGGVEWMHLASTDDAPPLAAQLGRLEPLDRAAMGALWQLVEPGSVLVITDEREAASNAAQPLLVARTRPSVEAETPSPTSTQPRNRPARVPRPPRQRPPRRSRRAPPKPEPSPAEPFPPTRERYPGANTVSEYG